MIHFRQALVIIIILSLSAPLAAQGDLAEAYLFKYREVAIGQMERYKIPASIILAQALLESANGTSTLALEGNNHFGIKCHEWKGDKIFKDDDKKGECFRKYSSPIDSYEDHSLFLSSRARYQPLFDLNITDYRGWAEGLKKAGYATNPNYSNLLISIIERYSLFELDSYRESAPIADRVASLSTLSERVPLDRAFGTINGLSFIIVNKGDSYKSIAKEYNLFKRELLRFNDLKRGEAIERGTILFLHSKKSQGAIGKSYHRVVEGETLHSISQFYGIKLKSLIKLNQPLTNREVRVGEMVKLRKE